MPGRGACLSVTLVCVAIEGHIATPAGRRGRPTPTLVAALALFAVAFMVFAATAERGGGHLDYWSANFASWHLAHTGSPFVEGVSMPPLDDNTERFVWLQEPAPNGHTVIARAPGIILAGRPGYLISGQDAFTLGPASLTVALLAALTAVLVFLALRTRLSVAGLAVALLGGLGLAAVNATAEAGPGVRACTADASRRQPVRARPLRARIRWRIAGGGACPPCPPNRVLLDTLPNRGGLWKCATKVWCCWRR